MPGFDCLMYENGMYRLLVLILKNLIEEGHITEEKIKSIRKAISKKYRPVIGWLEANE